MSDAAREQELRARGREAFDAGRFAEARQLFTEAAACHSDRPWPWLWLARAQRMLGDIEASYDAISQALKCQPDLHYSLWHLVDLHLDSGRTCEAIEVLARLVDRRGDDPVTLRRAGQRLLKAGAVMEALKVADAALRLDPHDGSALVVKGTALLRLGRPDDLDRFIDSDLASGAKGPASARVRVLAEAGRAREAWALIAQREEPPSPELARLVAHRLRQAGYLRDAMAAYDLAVGLPGQPADVTVWRDRVRGEVAVLSEAWRPMPARVGAVAAQPGRILHLVGKSAPHAQTGYTVRTHSIARAQRDVGLDPHVVTQLGFPWTTGVSKAAAEDAHDGISYHRLLPVDGRLPSSVDQLLQSNVDALGDLIRGLRPSLLHAASDYRNALLALACRRAFALPVVYEVRGFWEETWLSKQQREAEDSDGYLWRRLLELQMALESDHVVTLSAGMKAELVARGIADEQVTVVPNAVDADVFVPVERPEDLAARWEIRDDEVVIGYISSFVAYEGIRHLVDAVARLAKDGYPVRGVLVGDGEERPALERQAADLGMADRIIFTGRVTHARVLAYYGLIDVFVVPRTAARVCQLVTPLKPYEAMATGRALVVSGTEALREMVDPGRTGMVFEPENSEALAEVLADLVDDRELRRQLGQQARSWVSEHRTWRANGERYRRLYERMGVL